VPFFIVTHRPEDEPDGAGFTFVGSLDEALARAREAAGDNDVGIMGGADIIRQALRAGVVDELTISTAPVVLGAGKRLFEGFDLSLDLVPIRVLQSTYATHVTYGLAG
jgi:dihydrofolate reductase